MIPRYRFDLHSAAHNMINMTGMPDELQRGEAGLEYLDMDPLSVAIHEDGRRVRFWRSVQRTIDSIAESDEADARAYERFMALAFPVVDYEGPLLRRQVINRRR